MYGTQFKKDLNQRVYALPMFKRSVSKLIKDLESHGFERSDTTSRKVTILNHPEINGHIEIETQWKLGRLYPALKFNSENTKLQKLKNHIIMIL